jgi:hypothetical protein
VRNTSCPQDFITCLSSGLLLPVLRTVTCLSSGYLIYLSSGHQTPETNPHQQRRNNKSNANESIQEIPIRCNSVQTGIWKEAIHIQCCCADASSSKVIEPTRFGTHSPTTTHHHPKESVEKGATDTHSQGEKGAKDCREYEEDG